VLVVRVWWRAIERGTDTVTVFIVKVWWRGTVTILELLTVNIIKAYSILYTHIIISIHGYVCAPQILFPVYSLLWQ
jgi:hypothetical protein